MTNTMDHDIYTWESGVFGATGHPTAADDEDITRPEKLDVLKEKYGKTGSTNCHVLEAASSGQHSLNSEALCCLEKQTENYTVQQ
mmetsp:Transcript_20510/g.50315  ORF Transcript_20510/g.50315 Transcript_20510/m.50315 type:complete len:85 (-) Transcript_20510:306-560(-)